MQASILRTLHRMSSAGPWCQLVLRTSKFAGARGEVRQVKIGSNSALATIQKLEADIKNLFFKKELSKFSTVPTCSGVQVTD